jgi:hypothetical protein
MVSRVVRIICGLGAFGVIATSTVSLVGWIGQTTETTSTTIEARGMVAIDVRTNAGAIVVNGGDQDTIEITRRASFAFAKPHFDETTEKGILTLHAYCSRTAFGPCDVTYAISVPRGVSVRARSGGGSITVRDVDGTVDVDSSAGGVRAERVSGPLTMSSSAGGIDAVDIRSADVSADTSAGSVRLSFVVAPDSVKARSEAGSIRVTVPDDAATYRVEAGTSVGSTRVLVRTNPTSARSINVSTSAGSVYVEYPNN